MSARYRAALEINSKTLKFLPNKPKRKKRRPRYVEPALLRYLKDSLTEWELRGGPPETLVDQILRSFDRKYNDLMFDVPLKEDPPRTVAARECPEFDWAKTVAHTLQQGEREHVCVLLVPMVIKPKEKEVVASHMSGNYLIRDQHSSHSEL
eukprot:sb/3473505/